MIIRDGCDNVGAKKLHECRTECDKYADKKSGLGYGGYARYVDRQHCRR